MIASIMLHLGILMVLLYAGWWDRCVRRVPNKVWGLSLLVMGPLAIVVRSPGLMDLALVGIVLLGGWVYRQRGVWGMGDTKACAWVVFLLGPLPGLIVIVGAFMGSLLLGKHYQSQGGVPFVWLLALCGLPGVVLAFASTVPGVWNWSP